MHVPSLHAPGFVHRRHRRTEARAAAPERAHGSSMPDTSTTRWVTGLIALATGLLLLLWTLGALGYADTDWWNVLAILAIAVVAAFGAWIVGRSG